MNVRPNLLVIIADQLSQKALRMYGDRYSRTPHLDSLAEQGVRFSQAYTPCPLCQPARAALWTGRFPHETGVESNGRLDPVTPIPEQMPTLGSLFQEAGYETVHFGKDHGAGSLRGFHCSGEENRLPVEPVAPWPVYYGTREDRYTTTEAARYLAGSTRKPFLAVVDLVNPHDICEWIGTNRGEHEDLPVPELPELPDNFEVHNFAQLPRPVQYICCAHNRQSQVAPWTEMNFRHYLAAYYHYVARLDAEIGLVLEALQAGGHADQTVVVFLADHGDSMVSRHLVTKHTSFYDETTKVPLLFAGPPLAARGGQLEAPLTSLLDVLPTLCDFAGIAPPSGLWGRSLRPWIMGKAPSASPHPWVASEWRTEWGYTIEPGRMIRTESCKYTRYLEGDGEELYDLKRDPGETRSLVFESEYAEALLHHRELLQEHLQSTADPFFDCEVKAAPRWRRHAPGYHHHSGPAAPEAESA